MQLQLPHKSQPITSQPIIKGIRLQNGKLKRYAERVNAVFQISDDPSLLDMAYALRYKVFDREIHMFRGDDDSRRESDKFDPYARHAFLYLDGEFASYARLILDNEHGFPSEKYHSFPLSDIRSRCVELSRATSVKKWRRSEAIWIGFFLSLEYCAKNEIDFVLGFSNANVMNGLKTHNLTYHYVGEPTWAYNRIMYPYIIDVHKSLS